MNKAKYQLGQAVKAENKKGVVSKIFETSKDEYLYEVLRNGDYELYLEKELELIQENKNTLEDMSKEELLELIKTYSNYVDINSKMLKVSIMNVSDYINSNKYKDLSNQKDEIGEVVFNTIEELDKVRFLSPWDWNKEEIKPHHFKLPSLITDKMLKMAKNIKSESGRELSRDININDYCKDLQEEAQKIYTDFFIPSSKYMRENAHNLSKININNLKRGDKVLILNKNLIASIIDVNHKDNRALVLINNTLYIVNIDNMRKVIKVEK